MNVLGALRRDSGAAGAIDMAAHDRHRRRVAATFIVPLKLQFVSVMVPPTVVDWPPPDTPKELHGLVFAMVPAAFTVSTHLMTRAVLLVNGWAIFWKTLIC